MKALFVLLALAGPVGEATYYNPGIMERVRAYRLEIGQIERCADCVDAVALLDCNQIGKRVWLQHPAGEVVGPLQVVDCAQRAHVPALRLRQWVADVSYKLGRHWKMSGPLEGVRVLWSAPQPMPGRPHKAYSKEPDRDSRGGGGARTRRAGSLRTR